MIDISNVNVAGFIPAIKGIRNSYQSYDKSDTDFGIIGDNDKKLMRKLVKAGEPHCKFRRMIQVWADINAPLFWWKQYDTYKVGTVANSESTMHNILDNPFSIDNFTVTDTNEPIWDRIIYSMNGLRDRYLEAKESNDRMLMDIYWRTIIEMLPSGYMQKRTVNLNYSVLAGIYKQRKGHKLTEWAEFCEWIESLPESWIITGRTE